MCIFSLFNIVIYFTLKRKDAIVGRKKMIKAFFMMLNCKSSNQYRYNSSRLYAKLRSYFSLVQSENQLGEKNSQFGTVWIRNRKTKDSKRINVGEDLPVGWEYGRIVNTKVDKLKEFVDLNFDNLEILQSLELNELQISNRLKLKIETQIKKLLYKKELQSLHDLYIMVGFDEMVRQTGYKFSLANLVQTFSRNLDFFIPHARIKRGS
jgi:hypothetical protein